MGGGSAAENLLLAVDNEEGEASELAVVPNLNGEEFALG